MKTLSDYFKDLGLSEGASVRQITKAYRKKAKKTHPDKNPNDPKAKEKFCRIKQAYDYLKSYCKKRESDEELLRKKREEEEKAAKVENYFLYEFTHFKG